MKLICIAIIGLLFLPNAWAQQCSEPVEIAKIPTSMLGSVPAAAPTETRDFYWSADYGGGDTEAERLTALITNDTGTLVATKEGTPDQTTDQNHTSGGAYSFLLDQSNEGAYWAITSKNIFDSAEGYISLWVYPTTIAAFGALLEIYNASTDQLFIYMTDGGVVIARYVGNNVTVTNDDNTDVIATGAWYHVEVRWSVSLNKVEVRIANAADESTSGFVTDADTDAMQAMTAEPTSVRIGEYVSGFSNSDFYIDDVEIWLKYDKS